MVSTPIVDAYSRRFTSHRMALFKLSPGRRGGKLAGPEDGVRGANTAVVKVRYAATEIAPAKSARARGAYLRVSFKNTRETAQAINGWKLQRAVKFLENVKEKKEAVPLRRYAGSVGRTAQGTITTPRTEQEPCRRWDSAERRISERAIAQQRRIANASSHRQAVWCHARSLARQVGRLPARPAQERRVQRRLQRSRHEQPDCQAHPSQPGPQAATADVPRSRPGTFSPTPDRAALAPADTPFLLQINPYMSNPCHIELILTEGEEVVQKSDAVVGRDEARLNSRQRGRRVRQAITAA